MAATFGPVGASCIECDRLYEIPADNAEGLREAKRRPRGWGWGQWEDARCTSVQVDVLCKLLFDLFDLCCRLPYILDILQNQWSPTRGRTVQVQYKSVANALARSVRFSRHQST
jgi:hypothetical protein